MTESGHGVPDKKRGAGGQSLPSTLPFKILVLLLAIALLLQFMIIFALVSHPGAPESVQALLRNAVFRNPANTENVDRIVKAEPKPVLNARTSNGPADTGKVEKRLGAKSKVLANTRAAGESAHKPQSLPPHLYPRLPHLPPFSKIPDGESLAHQTMHGHPTIAGVGAIMNKFLFALHESNRGMAGDRSMDRDTVINAFFDLASKYLLPFDAVYRGRSIFPIREDDSIFVSLASFRDHLLGDTLRELYGKAVNPKGLFIGAIVQNCFGVEYTCRTGAQVVGKDSNGRDKTKISDAPPDRNGIDEFCTDEQFSQYCDAGQVRVLYVNETESLGPAMARYYASKLWGGEQFFMQSDSHLQFAVDWDKQYVEEVKAASSYPKAVLSSYPPGFEGFHGGGTPGAKLCACEFSGSDVEDQIIRINVGKNYQGFPPRPTQIPFIAAGFFFAHAKFLVDVPFDPLMPWCFMGEEIALSMRAWTSGWNIYAPRKNLLAHQYRPGRMGLPKFWGTVGRLFGRPGPGFSNKIGAKIIHRVKHLVGYPEDTRDILESKGYGIVLTDAEHYGLGTNRTHKAYLDLAQIDLKNKKCHRLPWCNQGELD